MNISVHYRNELDKLASESEALAKRARTLADTMVREARIDDKRGLRVNEGYHPGDYPEPKLTYTGDMTPDPIREEVLDWAKPENHTKTNYAQWSREQEKTRLELAPAISYAEWCRQRNAGLREAQAYADCLNKGSKLLDETIKPSDTLLPPLSETVCGKLYDGNVYSKTEQPLTPSHTFKPGCV